MIVMEKESAYRGFVSVRISIMVQLVSFLHAQMIVLKMEYA
jgi:hypothetical protein